VSEGWWVDHMSDTPTILITGGAGFIGTNLAKSFLEEGKPVNLLDNLSRPGVSDNLTYLRSRFRSKVGFIEADVRDRAMVREAVSKADVVFHFAAQVAVTTSLEDPLTDFGVNAAGTLNVLEAARLSPRKPTLVFTSTNKVYGALDQVQLRRCGSHYEPADCQLANDGVDESMPLDFHSPYGCSKGSADQYVLDYGRCYGFRTVVFRMSCICGPHQQGTEDQGWVAYFVRKLLHEEPITIYGDGLQVRDVLYVTDLVRAFRLATAEGVLDKRAVFNIGGGVARAASVLEVLDLIRQTSGVDPHVGFAEPRTGDQRWYVSNHGRFTQLTGWTPKVTLRDTVQRMVDWFSAEKSVPALAGKQRSSQCATL
jgi:CDP-paratose 2-epimerase